MFTISIEDFMLELKDGAFKNVGPATKSASAKLFDVESATVREFGDKRVKLVFEDEEGNEVQVALFPDHVDAISDDIERLRDESDVFQ